MTYNALLCNTRFICSSMLTIIIMNNCNVKGMRHLVCLARGELGHSTTSLTGATCSTSP